MSSTLLRILLVSIGVVLCAPTGVSGSTRLDDEDAGSSVSADTIITLLSARAEEDVQADIRAAQEVTLDAGRARALAELDKADAKARKEMQEERIDALEEDKKRIENLRDQTQDEAARAEFERQKDDLERRKDLEEKWKRLFEAEESLAESERELARALERQAQADTEFYRRELQFVLAGASAQPEVERRVLEAWKTAMERAEDVASRRKRVIERQISVLDRAKDIREH